LSVEATVRKEARQIRLYSVWVWAQLAWASGTSVYVPLWHWKGLSMCRC